jgi:EmrB/QacA subfamily drug resistance transporter
MRELPQREKMFVLGGILLAMLLGALDSTIVGPAMPTIIRDLGGMSLYAWVFMAYSLTSTIAVPIVGKLGDLYGRKWFYLPGIAIFLLGSALSGAAGSSIINDVLKAVLGQAYPMQQLIVFRALQGVGGGMMMANGAAIIGDLFAPAERGRYQGFMGASFGLASIIGPAVGGWITDTVSWRWVFYVNIPLGLLTLAVLLKALPAPERGRQHALDWWGSLALTIGLVPLLLALNWGGSQYAWDSRTILALFGVTLAALVWFILLERRHPEPILSMELFKNPSFVASVVVLFLSGVGMFGSIMFLPQFIQLVQGRSAASSGALLTPMMISMVIAATLSGQVIGRTGKYKWMGVAGLGISAGGMFLLSRLGIDTSALYVTASMVMIGVGLGVTMPLFMMSMQSMYPTRIGEVTAATQFFRSIGGTVGVALLGGVMNASLKDELAKLIAEHSAKLGPLSGVLKQAGGDASKLLNPSAMKAIGAKLQAAAAGMPPVQAKALMAGFAQFQSDLKLSLATATADTFFWGFLIMFFAFLAMFLVREVPILTREDRPTAEEVGRQLLAEEAVLPAEGEPELA